MHWRREAMRQVETVVQAEQFVEQVGFAACLTDSRRPGPSLYVAVCGRRDAGCPATCRRTRGVAHLGAQGRDDAARQVYYAKLARGGDVRRTPLIPPSMRSAACPATSRVAAQRDARAIL